VLVDAEVEVIPKSSKYHKFVPDALVSLTRINTLVKLKLVKLTTRCTYVVDIVPEYVFLDVHVVPSGDVSTTNPWVALVVLRLNQKETTPGFAICGVRIISPAALKDRLCVPVLKDTVLYVIEV